MQLPHFAIVIPAFNEVATIRDVVVRALRFGATVIVVDDGSTDSTSDALRGLAITLLRNETNRGKADSLWRGFQHAMGMGAAAAITLDGDGQHSPEDIPRLMAAWKRSSECLIIGTRQRDWYSSLSIRVLANKTADFGLSWAAGYSIRDSQSGFRVYPLVLLRDLDIDHGKANSFVFESEILLKAARLGRGTASVPVRVASTKHGRRSHYRPILDTCRITRMVWRSLCAIRFSLGDLLRSFTLDTPQRPRPLTSFRPPP